MSDAPEKIPFGYVLVGLVLAAALAWALIAVVVMTLFMGPADMAAKNTRHRQKPDPAETTLPAGPHKATEAQYRLNP